MTSHSQQQYHESITIDPYMEAYNSRGVKVSIQTKAIYNFTSFSFDDESESSILFLNGKHKFLTSILKQMQLDSLLISISDSSDNSMSLSEMNLLHSKSMTPLIFPVGTAVQYKKNVSFTNNSTSYYRTDSSYVDEKVLLRLLSANGLLCQNVQLNDILKSIYPTSTNGSDKDERIIMIPNDAYTLCHSRTLHKIISSSNPCQMKLGVFSEFQFDSMNDGNVFNKATWMSIQRSGDNLIEIEWGIRFKKRLFKDEYNHYLTLSDIMSNQLLSSNSEYDSDDEYHLNHCPLTESSIIYIRNNDTYKEYDLKNNQISMNAELVQFNNINDEVMGIIGIDRRIARPSGVAHFGLFQSRYYFRCGQACQTHFEIRDGVNISIVENYPSVIKPIFHTAKAFLVNEGSRGGNGNITEIEFDDYQNHYHLNFLPDGTTSLSFSYQLPPETSMYVQMNYEPKYLPFEHFPADPNRGFDVPASYASFSPMFGPSPMNVQLYSNALLVMPPVPDMSMPFNVIALCSTCFALLIGTAMNLIIKKSSQSVSDKLKGIKRKTPLQKLKDRLAAKITSIRQKITTKRSQKQELKVKLQ